MKRVITLIILTISVIMSLFSQDVIEMRKEASGIYTIPCEVNGLKLRFIFDTGASSVSISLTEATFMLKNGYLDEEDITGSTNVQLADGNIAENYMVNLKELKIGSVTLKNVEATVSSGLDAPLLLGQSVLDQLGHWSFKNSNLILNDFSGKSDHDTLTWEELEEMAKHGHGDREYALSILRRLVNEENEYAAYVFLTNVADPGTSSRLLLNDLDIKKAMDILELSKTEDPEEIFLNFEKLIWFSLYRLNDKNLAIKYLNNIEAKNLSNKENYDELADLIISHIGWGSNNKIDKTLAQSFFNKGYYKAYCTYGIYLQDKNHLTDAFNAYKACSSKGYTPATIYLGKCYLDGIGTVKNKKIGLSLLENAAQEGYIEAITELCGRYYHGIGVTQNFDKVLEYASLYGHEGLIDQLYKAYTGIAYWAKKEYRYALQELNEVDVFYDEDRSRSNMISIFNAGLNWIYDDVLAAVGKMYSNGLGCKLDLDKAFRYYSKLAEHNPQWGYGELGDMFFINELVQENAEQAYQYYLLGANNGSGYCYYRLALMNYYGVGTIENHTKAQEYKAQALKAGFSQSDFKF